MLQLENDSFVRVLGSGAITALGSGVHQTDAALRAKIGAFRTEHWSPGGAPAVMALVPEERLSQTEDEVCALVQTPWQARLIALTTHPLLEAAPPGNDPLVVMLGLPHPQEMPELPSAAVVWAALQRATGRRIDDKRSRLFPVGRAAMFAAYEAAAKLCREDPSQPVLCGAADSYADGDRIGRELLLLRTLGAVPATDGRALGEAAAFLLLQAADRRRTDAVEVAGVAVVDDPGHRFGTQPDRGEGVAEALEVVRSALGPMPPFGSVWAGMTGERHDGKHWGVAQLRHRDLFTAGTRLLHPADCIGDAGAGLGALLFVVARARLLRAHGQGASLLWATSDHGCCGCAVMRNETDGGA